MTLRSFPLLIALVLTLHGCGEESPARGGSEGPRAGVVEGLPDIVLVTVDTLRADHLGCYGYPRDTTPVIDALAAEGVVFELAISPMATTLPAHLSLMTGLYPHQHGYLANRGAVKAPFRSSPGRRPAAELLKKAGYATAAFVSGPTVSRATGIQTGFELFDQHEIVEYGDIFDHSRRAGETIARAIDWLDSGPGRPFFLWVHLWDPHEPNVPIEPWASMFPADEVLDRIIDERGIDPEQLAERFSDLELARLFAPDLIADLRDGKEVKLPPIDRDAVRDLFRRYDADVRYIDDSLGELFAKLCALGRWNDTIVAVTSDHGQALGQHDWLEHGRIQIENTHVPLIVRFPGGLLDASGRYEDVVSLVDVLPTLLARIDSEAAAELLAQAEGVDLFSGSYDRPWAFSQRSVRVRDWEGDHEKNGTKLGLTLGKWRYYHRPDGVDELYDLSTDPGERVDLAEAEAERVQRLRSLTREIAERRAYVPGETPMSPEAAQFLDSLKTTGYVGEED